MKYRIAMLYNNKVDRSGFVSTLEACQEIINNGPTKLIKSIWIEVVR